MSQTQLVAYALWWIMLGSWLLAGLWSSRAEARPKGLREQPYFWLNALAFFLVFQPPGTRYTPPLWVNPPAVEWALIALMIAGFAFCWWARVHLGRLWSGFVTRKADHRIVDTGPYGLVRHPIYTGLILAGVSLSLMGASLLNLVGAALFISSFWIKARLEERFLAEGLGEEAYAAYRRRVPMLAPFTPASWG